ncbi:MAG: hypothetical protein HYU36_05135 [Planctomycetes bacterium]|nr:hypothetical protein [Planctomycetota bacterium]
MPDTASPTLPSVPVDLPIVELSGTPRCMGEAFGEACRREIRELYEIRLRHALVFAREAGRRFRAEQVIETARLCLRPTEAYHPAGHEESCGIARGAGLAPEQVFVLQGLTDLRDLLAWGKMPETEGCSSFIVGPDRAAGGRLLLGQNWDLYTDNMPFLRLVHRRPVESPETWSLTAVGCLCLIGLNSEGIAAGNTNLKTCDVRIGVQYLSVLHRALASRTLDEAIRAVVEAPRAAAHYFYVGGPEGKATGIECSALQSAAIEVRSGVFVHCNHMLIHQMRGLEVGDPADSTCFRQERLTRLLESHPGPISVESLKWILSDHEGGPLAICRHDGPDRMSTNACVVLCPSAGEIHACRAQPHLGRWVTKRVRS